MNNARRRFWVCPLLLIAAAWLSRPLPPRPLRPDPLEPVFHDMLQRPPSRASVRTMDSQHPIYLWAKSWAPVGLQREIYFWTGQRVTQVNGRVVTPQISEQLRLAIAQFPGLTTDLQPLFPELHLKTDPAYAYPLVCPILDGVGAYYTTDARGRRDYKINPDLMVDLSVGFAIVVHYRQLCQSDQALAREMQGIPVRFLRCFELNPDVMGRILPVYRAQLEQSGVATPGVWEEILTLHSTASPVLDNCLARLEQGQCSEAMLVRLLGQPPIWTSQQRQHLGRILDGSGSQAGVAAVLLRQAPTVQQIFAGQDEQAMGGALVAARESRWPLFPFQLERARQIPGLQRYLRAYLKDQNNALGSGRK